MLQRAETSETGKEEENDFSEYRRSLRSYAQLQDSKGNTDLKSRIYSPSTKKLSGMDLAHQMTGNFSKFSKKNSNLIYQDDVIEETQQSFNLNDVKSIKKHLAKEE